MYYENVKTGDLTLDPRELAARLSAPDMRDVETEIDRALERLAKEAKPSFVAERVNLIRQDGGIIIGGAVSHSRALERFLEGCDSCVLLVATLGIGTDRLIIRESSRSPYDAFVTDAVADALIEALCDYAEDRVCQDLGARGRFSPGYADLDISFGEEIIRLTGAEKLLGIKMTEGGMMTPRKSVSAILR